MPATYEQAQQAIFARGTVPDGYFGRTTQVGFALIDGQIMVVAKCGYYRLGMPAIDEREALWLLQNHPHCKRIVCLD